MPLYISESRQRRKRKSVPVSAGTAEEKADAVWCMTCAGSSLIPTPTPSRGILSPQAQWTLLNRTISNSDFFSVRTPACLSQSHSLGNLSKNTGAYKPLDSLTLPPQSSPDYVPTLVCQSRAHRALNNPKSTALPPNRLWRYDDQNRLLFGALHCCHNPSSGESSEGAKAVLEELRDLSVKIGGD